MNMNDQLVSTDLAHSLRSLTASELEPMFWTPHRLGKASAWWAHVPFAFWIMSAARPRLFVELGTHNGVSYAAFCESVQRGKLATRCYAVDTWEGDAHAGAFDAQIYYDLREFHDRHFGAFSELLRCRFDEALTHFSDNSIDLLHIDGFHTYEAVRHDFETWRPKLSDRAVVLFHDTNVRDKDFGVYRYFAELAEAFPTFEFLHGYGLGLVAVGKSVPAEVMALCAMGQHPSDVSAVRERFTHLGARWFLTTREQLGQADFAQKLAHTHAEQATAIAGIEANAQIRIAEVNAQREDANARLEQANVQLEQANAQLQETRARVQAVLMPDDESFVEIHEFVEQSDDEGEAALVPLQPLVEKIVVQKELAQAAASKAVASALAAEKVRSRTARRIAELRAAAEGIRAEAVVTREKFAALAMRYSEVFADPALGIKARLRARARRILATIRRTPDRMAEIEVVRRSIYFHREWYLRANPDVAASGVDPVVHYVVHGAREGREPGPWFSGQRYLDCNPDVRAAGVNPLSHYILFGLAEGRSGGESQLAALPQPERFHAASSGNLALFYVSGEPDSPGNQYRVTRFVDAAIRNGAVADWIRVDQLEDNLDRLATYDVLVIWRAPWTDAIEAAVTFMRGNGKRIVFDVDDLMIDPNLAKTDIIDGIRSQWLTDDRVRGHFAEVRKTMDAADVCFTTTQELAFHMRWAGKTTHVLPNGFDQRTHDVSRLAARHWRRNRTDELIRIGYAGGSRTHQRDLGLAIEAIAKVLRENARCRLVLFRAKDGLPLIDVEEYPVLAGLLEQIEWRPIQLLANLPNEMVRFDINVAPLEFGNPFCEAKSELKFFEAALVGVPTVASPTGPFRRAIEHGVTGFLAASADDWYEYLSRLLRNPALREQMAGRAYHAALAKFGPMQCAAQFGRMLDQLQGGLRAGRGFALEAHMASRPYAAPKVFPSQVVFEQDKLGVAEVTVIVPLYNYEKYIVEALDSVSAQTLQALDLVVVDDFSTDDSLQVATEWAQRHANRFNRIAVLKNNANYGLGFCRNSAFNAADTPYVLPLDADNKLLPECCARLLTQIQIERCAYVYPTIQQFGASTALMGAAPYDAQRFVAGNYVDAMALVSKEAWAIVGGYDHVRHGWEDYNFWCRLAERGLVGQWKDEVLAGYRVHAASMITAQTTVPANYRRLLADFQGRHPWVSLIDVEIRRDRPKPDPHLRDVEAPSRIDVLLPILRCPATKQKLAFDRARETLLSLDGLNAWPVVEGRPVLAADFPSPEVKPKDHISNELPEEALDIIRNTRGWVLNLSGGGSREKFDHVVEVEYAIFRHTDVVSDAHELPFDDSTFDAAVVMNAFEHYREPHKVVSELLRVLKPGGLLHVRTAFMQPLHERPWHFFNCTRHGLEEWFKSFKTEKLHVSDNFCPNHSIAWMASEAECALRQEVSSAAGDNFRAATLGDLVDIWRDPSKRDVPLWKDFTAISQPTQEVTAAGFEFFGRKPSELPKPNG